MRGGLQALDLRTPLGQLRPQALHHGARRGGLGVGVLAVVRRRRREPGRRLVAARLLRGEGALRLVRALLLHGEARLGRRQARLQVRDGRRQLLRRQRPGRRVRLPLVGARLLHGGARVGRRQARLQVLRGRRHLLQCLLAARDLRLELGDPRALRPERRLEVGGALRLLLGARLHLGEPRRQVLAAGLAELLLQLALARLGRVERGRGLAELLLELRRARALLLRGPLCARGLRLQLLHLGAQVDDLHQHGGRGAGVVGVDHCGAGPRRLGIAGRPRRDRRDGGRPRGRRHGRRAEPDRLDQRRQLAHGRLEVADVALGQHAGAGRDDEEAAERAVALVDGQADDRAYQRRALDERRHVAVLRGAVDQVRASVEEPVQRHVPARDVAAPHAAQAPAAVVGEVALRREPQQLLPLVEEADGAAGAAHCLDDPAQRRLERVLGRRRVADDRLQALRGRLGLARRRGGPPPPRGRLRGLRSARTGHGHTEAFCNACAAAPSGI
jgi:hypothetical protein